jgi:hypothetical protein
MKKTILIIGTAIALVGCSKTDTGGTSDQYGTERGGTSGTITRERVRTMTNSTLATNDLTPSSQDFTNNPGSFNTNSNSATDTNTNLPR